MANKINFSGILTISGSPGTGKATLIASLLQCVPNSVQSTCVTTCTSHDPKNVYRYISEDEFRIWQCQGKLFYPEEDGEVKNSMLRSEIDEVLAGDEKKLIIIESPYYKVELLRNYATGKGKESLIRSVFLDPTGDVYEMHRRMLERGDSEAQAKMNSVDCCNLSTQARTAPVDFRFVNALHSKAVVLDEVLSLLCE